MKIAVYHNLISGGNKRSLFEKVRGFKRYGHTVHVYNLSITNESFTSLKGIADQIITRKVPLFQWKGIFQALNPLGQILQLFFLARANRTIAQAINGKDYDFVWVANCFLTQHSTILRHIKKPHLLYTAEHHRAIYDKVLWKRLNASSSHNGILLKLYRIYRRVALYFVGSVDQYSISQTKNVLVNSYFTKENILRFYNVIAHPLYLGIDLERFCSRGLERENMILSIGGLNPLKGHDLVLRSLMHIAREQRPRMVIIADRVENSGEHKRYCDFARSNDIELEIVTQIEDADLIDYYNRAKITVCANILEPFGLVPVESMGCGTPVVAVKEGGFRESIIHEQTGLLVERDDLALGRAIKRLLEDEGLWSTLAQQGSHWAQEQFSLERFWADLEKQIQSVAANDTLDYEI